MRQLYRRIVASLLLCIMVISTPLSVLAETPGNSGASGRPVPVPGGSGLRRQRQFLMIMDFVLRLVVQLQWVV